MNTDITSNTDTRDAAIKGLAVVGFVALVAAGIALAIFTARYVPSTVSRLGAAAVTLSSFFVPRAPANLEVVSDSPTTTASSAGTATATSTATPAANPAPPSATRATPRTAGPEQTETFPISGAAQTPTLSGLPDLALSSMEVGYLTSTSSDSFIASSTVPVGNRPAVKFTVANIGTNVAGAWRFSASIPAQTPSAQAPFVFQSPAQQSLNPGDRIDYVLGFDRTAVGVHQPISVTVNDNRAIAESNYGNDSESQNVTILGS